MGKFLESEKPVQANFKATSRYFSDNAKPDGIYKNNPYPFCLPRSCAKENLFPEIQSSTIAFFTEHEIKWHDGQDGNPSNHLCDSMVCCVNFLFPFSDKPKALAKLLSKIYPGIQEMLPIESNRYVTFEWIGQKNYLGEIKSKNRKRTRGANFTSADAAVKFRRLDGCVQIVLIEWKYTEAYFKTNLKFAKSGRDRTKIYAHLYNNDEDLLDKELLTSFDLLFFEPFYQFMRQQYLANEMEKAHELGADTVSLLHIAPAHNLDFKRITSPDLGSLGESATDVWGKLVKKPGRFHSVATEDLFSEFDIIQYPNLKNWYEYITERYTWMAK